MARRWSKLKSKIEALFSENLDLQIHCTTYMTDNTFGAPYPRHWIVLDKKIIFDFPSQFLEWKHPGVAGAVPYIDSETGTLSDLMEEYLETPKLELLDKVFERDQWGFTDILKASDRRLGKSRLAQKFENRLPESAVAQVLNARGI